MVARKAKRRTLELYFILMNFFYLPELEAMPVGTGVLYVTDDKHPSILRTLKPSTECTEREEALVVQYLALGGHSRFTGFSVDTLPFLIASSIHAGPGQQVFGYSKNQRCDLLLAFDRSSTMQQQPVELHYHNFHGDHWHYTGHFQGCTSTKGIGQPFFLTPETRDMDLFRRIYAEAMTNVRPKKVKFFYSTSSSCDFFHGNPIKSLKPDCGATYFELADLLKDERSEDFYLPINDKFFDKNELKKKILSGEMTGFVTLKGGRETSLVLDEAKSKFGFCVQSAAPSKEQVSDYTKEQIKEYNGFSSLQEADDFLTHQPARTLNSTTFHSEETISTNYLRWLMTELGFDDFDITHFIWYAFNDHTKDFIEPLLQLRHDLKQKNILAAAEIIKLLLNGDYG